MRLYCYCYAYSWWGSQPPSRQPMSNTVRKIIAASFAT